MPITPPPGFLTRAEAPKKFNRSQRALERDLDVALTIDDADVLSHYKLVTKDGLVRDAGEVSVEQVKKLMAEGMVPTWCVEEAWLDAHYGRKGESKPRQSPAQTDPRTIKSEHNNSNEPEDSKVADAQKAESASVPILPDDVLYLKERVQTLEREKDDERRRHDVVVEKLWDEIAVKNRQISAWDEVTQGLTKALATGQIAPKLLSPAATQDWSSTDSDGKRSQKPLDAEVVDEAVKDGKPLQQPETDNRAAGKMRTETSVAKVSRTSGSKDRLASASEDVPTKTKAKHPSDAGSKRANQRSKKSRKRGTSKSRKLAKDASSKQSILHTPVDELLSRLFKR